LKCSLDRIDRRKFLRHAAWGGAAATICGVSARNLIASAPQTKQVPIAPATVLTTNTAEAVRTGRATFSPTWESLRSRHTPVPDWMRDAKYGIYCHCGVYSVPDYDSEHYEHRMYDDSPYTKYGTHQRQIAIYGPLEKFGYHSFILRTQPDTPRCASPPTRPTSHTMRCCGSKRCKSWRRPSLRMAATAGPPPLS
jgi:hypothetical protein